MRACGSSLFTPLGLVVAMLSAIVVISVCCADRICLFVLSSLVCYAWYCARFALYVVDLSKRPDDGKLRMQWSLRQMLIVVACVAAILGTVFQHWPFRARFLLSRSAFNDFANRLESGQEIEVPKELGFFMIERATMRGRVPCLWIDPEICFARCTPEQVRGFNLWSTEQMNDRWQLIIED